jgi:integrase
MVSMARGNNEGSIYFSKTQGLYRAAVSIPGGGRRYVSGRTREDCHTRLVKLLASIAEGKPIGGTDRLSPFLAWWLGTLEAKATAKKKSVNTVDNARWAVNHWIIPALGSKRLRELAPEDVEGLLADMVRAGCSHSTVVRVRSYLGQALAVAYRRGKVGWNVARIAEMPDVEPRPARRALTIDEARAILTEASTHRLNALFITAMMLGLRPGELTGLRWVDVDLDAATLEVSGSMKFERGKLRRGKPKTDGSDRPLSLPAPVVAALRIHRRAQKEERLAAGANWADLGLVFANQIGGPIDPSNLRTTVKRLCKRAGVPEISPNELGRHTAANLLYDAGVPLEQIADILGHESTRMLERHYRHKGRAALAQHVAPMEGLFPERPGNSSKITLM